MRAAIFRKGEIVVGEVAEPKPGPGQVLVKTLQHDAATPDTRVVWCDDGGGLGERAAQRMADLGSSDVSVLDVSRMCPEAG